MPFAKDNEYPHPTRSSHLATSLKTIPKYAPKGKHYTMVPLFLLNSVGNSLLCTHRSFNQERLSVLCCCCFLSLQHLICTRLTVLLNANDSLSLAGKSDTVCPSLPAQPLSTTQAKSFEALILSLLTKIPNNLLSDEQPKQSMAGYREGICKIHRTRWPRMADTTWSRGTLTASRTTELDPAIGGE